MHFFKSLTLIVTLALIGACSPATERPDTADSGGFAHYIDLSAGFSVDYPKGWTQWRDKGSGEFMFAAARIAGADHCWVFAERVSDAWLSSVEATLDSINIQLYLIKRNKEVKRERVLMDYRAPLAGYPARHFSVHFEAPLIKAPRGGPLRPVYPFRTELSVVYADSESHTHDRPFILGCNARQDVGDPDRLDRIMTRMRASFRPMR